jgi:hypothetical protein
MGLALVATAFALISVNIFWAHIGWFPVGISTHGAAIDHQFNILLILLVLTFGAICMFALRNRRRFDGGRVTDHNQQACEVASFLGTVFFRV